MWQAILKKKKLIADIAEASEATTSITEPINAVKEGKIVVDAIKDVATPKMRN